MKIPNKIRIGSVDYNVMLSKKTLILNNKVCFGTVHYTLHTIDVNNVLQDIQGMEQTFLHEVIHAIIYERNFSLNLKDDKDIEMIVNELAYGLHQLIRDNPGMFLDAKKEPPKQCSKGKATGTVV